MNGEFLRGEVYWWKFGDSVGSEEGAVRPGVIVSSEQGNKSSHTVNIVFLTTKTKYGRINVEVSNADRRSWAMCNQIATVDKLRVGNYMSTLSEEEMADIDRAIMSALGLHNVGDDEDEPNTDESDNDEIEALREELASLKHSGLAWKKLYEKALDEIASLRFEADLGKRIAVAPKVEEPVIAEPKVEKPVEEKPAEEESSLVDLNSCSESDLRKCGCDPQLIRNIIARRPYKTVYDLRFVPGLKSVGYAILKAKVCVGEPKQEERVPKVKPQKVETPKVNINTASAKELSAFVGLSENLMYAITGYRKRNGEYESVSELSKVERLPANFLERFGDKLMV